MAKITIGTAATKIVDANSTRTSLFLRNNSAVTIFVETSNSVTIDNGYPIPAGDEWIFNFSGSGDAFAVGIYKGELWGIAASSNVDLRIIEMDHTEFFG